MPQDPNGDAPDPGYLAALATLNVRIQTPDDPPVFTATPSSPMTPVHWRWGDLEKVVNELDQHLNLAPGGARRTLKLTNPGLPYGTTPTFWLSIQSILPGEVATAHRHTPTAFRFIMRGNGCWTTVDGESYEMSAGDFVLTPSWTWHDHIHRGDEPMIWIDVLDISLVRSLHTTFFQNYDRDVQDVAAVRDVSFRTRGSGLLRAGRRTPQPPGAVNPLLAYPQARALEALEMAKGLPADLCDDVITEYVNPTDGSPALNSLATMRQILRPGFTGVPYRHTGSKVYWVISGAGVTEIDGTRYEWTEGDFFAVPPWTTHHHENPYDSEASLFRVDDTAVLDKLGLYREEMLPSEASAGGLG
jgi:gentisate 1,2-dioxygenase